MTSDRLLSGLIGFTFGIVVYILSTLVSKALASPEFVFGELPEWAAREANGCSIVIEGHSLRNGSYVSVPPGGYRYVESQKGINCLIVSMNPIVMSPHVR